MAHTVTVDRDKIPTELQRSDLNEWHGEVPATIEFRRLYRWQDKVVGSRWMSDGSVLEVQFEDGRPVRGNVVENPSAVDPAEEVLWESDDRAEDELRMFVNAGLTPAEALDYWMVEVRGETASAWAEDRGRNHQAVSENVRKAREKLAK